MRTVDEFMIQQYSRSQYTDLRARIFGIFLAFSIKRGEDNRAPGSFFLLSWSSFFLSSDSKVRYITSLKRGDMGIRGKIH